MRNGNLNRETGTLQDADDEGRRHLREPSVLRGEVVYATRTHCALSRETLRGSEANTEIEAPSFSLLSRPLPFTCSSLQPAESVVRLRLPVRSAKNRRERNMPTVKLDRKERNSLVQQSAKRTTNSTGSAVVLALTMEKSLPHRVQSSQTSRSRCIAREFAGEENFAAAPSFGSLGFRWTELR